MLIKVRGYRVFSLENKSLTSRVSQNLVQGSLVNGSLGRVIDFKTAREAKTQGVDIAATEIQKDRGEMPRIPEWIMQANDKWPLVQFQNGVVMLCVRVSFEVNDADGKIEASRDQVCTGPYSAYCLVRELMLVRSCL